MVMYLTIIYDSTCWFVTDLAGVTIMKTCPCNDTAIFYGCKNDNFHCIFLDYFHIFAQNIYCGYTLEPPLTGTGEILTS